MGAADHSSENFDFRKRTKSFAVEIIHLYSSLSNESSTQVCGKQMLRSGTSIAANFREAYRARSHAEFTAKLGICLQEADETQLWLELLREGCNLKNERIDRLWKECDELISIMVSWVKKSKDKK
jgi:four helix bundle protein